MLCASMLGVCQHQSRRPELRRLPGLLSEMLSHQHKHQVCPVLIAAQNQPKPSFEWLERQQGSLQAQRCLEGGPWPNSCKHSHGDSSATQPSVAKIATISEGTTPTAAKMKQSMNMTARGMHLKHGSMGLDNHRARPLAPPIYWHVLSTCRCLTSHPLHQASNSLSPKMDMSIHPPPPRSAVYKTLRPPLFHPTPLLPAVAICASQEVLILSEADAPAATQHHPSPEASGRCSAPSKSQLAMALRPCHEARSDPKHLEDALLHDR
mmetsp:Transcript_65189/g.121521  ORF Transcript_65189/g.121521 Transcript_65189/m.121521 type:complete len:265 (+) Transcript_65189:689-1483(+)